MVDMIRTPFLLLLAACAVLALAACGSSGKDNNGGSDEDQAFDAALKYSKCMRDQGVDVPDPERGPNGGIIVRAGSSRKDDAAGKATSLGPDNPKFKAADKQCAKYREAGGGDKPSPAEQAKRNDAFIGYAQCMRSKGINFPDPKINGNQVQMRIGPGVRPDSAKFKAADKVCHPKLAAVEPGGAPSGAGTAVGP
jgi:hypothetical protein